MAVDPKVQAISTALASALSPLLQPRQQSTTVNAVVQSGGDGTASGSDRSVIHISTIGQCIYRRLHECLGSYTIIFSLSIVWTTHSNLYNCKF